VETKGVIIVKIDQICKETAVCVWSRLFSNET